jgi:hypothetical protein
MQCTNVTAAEVDSTSSIMASTMLCMWHTTTLLLYCMAK